MSRKKLGFVARVDNGGLGIESMEFIEHMKPDKILSIVIGELPVKRKYPGLISYGPPDDKIINEFLDGLDTVFTIETPYNGALFEQAKRKGIKRILRVNYEWLDNYDADLYVAPSLWHYNDIPNPKIYLPFPINRQRLPFKERKVAKNFVHIAGNLKAGYDRNGTGVLLEARKYLQTDLQFKSQKKIKGIKSKVKDVKNYWENWTGDIDVLVIPRLYAGQSLVLNEAMSCGIVPLMTDMEPQNLFLPKDLLIPVKQINKVQVSKEIEIAELDPKVVADKINSFIGKDISYYSQYVNKIAEAWSWDTLQSQYEKICRQL